MAYLKKWNGFWKDGIFERWKENLIMNSCTMFVETETVDWSKLNGAPRCGIQNTKYNLTSSSLRKKKSLYFDFFEWHLVQWHVPFVLSGWGEQQAQGESCNASGLYESEYPNRHLLNLLIFILFVHFIEMNE